MQKIAIIGNSCAGKSTLAKYLGEILDIEYHHLDKIQWKPGWVQIADDEFNTIHNNILKANNWIIDGFGTKYSMEKRLNEADTIILLDHPIIVNYWWFFKRQMLCVFRTPESIPMGCPMLSMTFSLIKVIWSIHKNIRPQLMKFISENKNSKLVFRIKSTKELSAFQKQLALTGRTGIRNKLIHR